MLEVHVKAGLPSEIYADKENKVSKHWPLRMQVISECQMVRVIFF